MNRGAIRLRAMEPEDLDFLYGMENDSDMWSVGNTSVPYSRYVLHDYIANATNDIYHDGQVRLIMENSEGEAVGIVDVFDFNAQHRRAGCAQSPSPSWLCRVGIVACCRLFAAYTPSASVVCHCCRGQYCLTKAVRENGVRKGRYASRMAV